MGKSYRRHHKRPKRKNTRRRRRGGADGDASSSSSWSSIISPSMRKTLSEHYQEGYKQASAAAQPHIDNMKDLHKQASLAAQPYMNKGKEYYGQASSAAKPYMDKASLAAKPHIQRFSSLFTKKPNVHELEHAKQASDMGVPSAFSPTAQTSAL